MNIKPLRHLNKIRENKKDTQKALTLVETLVAISILVVAVLGPLVIVSQALRTSFFARDQLTAYYLAQETIEHIRNMRDENSLTRTNASDWLKNITYQNGVLEDYPTVVAIDEPNPKKYRLIRNGGYVLEACPSNDCGKLTINTDSNVYGEINGNIKDSIYTREVVFYQAPGDSSATSEVNIVVIIKWNQVGGVYQFKLRENLLNWKIAQYPE